MHKTNSMQSIEHEKYLVVYVLKVRGPLDTKIVLGYTGYLKNSK